MSEAGRESEASNNEPDVTAHPTPIPASKRIRTVLILAAIAVLAYIVYLVPSVLTTAVGGIGLALVLSFPVRLFSRFLRGGFRSCSRSCSWSASSCWRRYTSCRSQSSSSRPSYGPCRA